MGLWHIKRAACRAGLAGLLAAVAVMPVQAGTVTITGNSVTDTTNLNAEIAAANASGTPYTITIAASGANDTINLAASITHLAPTQNVTIVGTGGAKIDGGGNRQLFAVDSGHVALQNLSLQNGFARGGAGGNSSAGAGGGGLGAGAGLFVNSAATVSLDNVAFSNNSAIGGNGGTTVANLNNGGAGGGGLNGGSGSNNAGTTGGNGGSGSGFPISGGPGGSGGGNGGPGATGGGGGGGSGNAAGTGGTGGTGGFGGGGGGGGGGSVAHGAGGTGVGGGDGSSGGGLNGQAGTGYGGAVFVMDGGSLIIKQAGDFAFANNAANKGVSGQVAKQNLGNDIFISKLGGTANNLTLQVDSGTSTFAGTASSTSVGSIAGEGGITKTGAGTLVLSGNNTYSGGTNLDAGTVNVGADTNLGAATGTLAFNGGTLQWGASFDLAAARAITLNGGGGSFDTGGFNTTVGQAIGGAGPLTKTGAGILTLSGTNTYAGGTNLNGGFVVVGADANLGAAAGGLIFDGGTLRWSAGFDLAATRAITLNAGGGAFDTGGFGTTIAQTIGGSGALTHAGPGILTLSGTNTYGGGTNLNGGTVVAGADANLGAAAGGLTFDGGALRWGASFDLAATRAITLNAFGGTFDTGGFNTTVASAIGGSGSLTHVGPGVLTLSGTNTYGGGTNLMGATVVAGADANLGAGTGGLTFEFGTLRWSASFDLAATRAITLNAGGGTFDTGGFNTTVASAIGGTGALTKAGAGTLTLSGINSYAGTTTVNAGTLAIASTGSITSNVTNNATFANSGAVTGAVTNTGTFTNNTGATVSGLLTNTAGTSTNFGQINSVTVNGGIVSNNGVISGAVTINGGTFGGTGAAGSTTVNAGGTLSPGNSIGVITINGNLVLGAGAIYRVEVSPTDADRTNVSGTAQLGGELRLVFQPGSYASNSYTILRAAGGRSGTFNTVTTQNLPATLSADVTYTSTDVLLVTLASQIAKTLAGTTANQKAVARAQDAAFNGGLPSILALYNLSLAQLPAALDQLSGEVHASTASVLVDESLYARSAILGRLRQASYGGESGMAALTAGGPQAFAGDEELSSALAYAKSPVVKAPVKAPAAPSDLVYWAQGFGAWGRFGSDGNAATLRRDLAGFMTGIDTRVGHNGRVGIAAGYTGSRNNLDGRGSANVETGHVAGYGGWTFGALALRAGGDFAFHSIATDRTIAFPGFFDRALANYDGRTGQIFGELGYGFAFANMALEPFAGGAWVRLKTDSAAERGGAGALNFAGTTFETGYATLGLRAASMIPLGDGAILIPRALLAWQHAFGNAAPGAVLAFQNAPVPFAIAGVPIARDALLAEAGLDLALGRNATIGVSYTGQVAANVTDHAAKGKFSWKF